MGCANSSSSRDKGAGADPYGPSAPSWDELNKGAGKKKCSPAMIFMIVIASLLIVSIVVLLIVQAVNGDYNNTYNSSKTQRYNNRENSVIYLNRDFPRLQKTRALMQAQNRNSSSGVAGPRPMLRSPQQHSRQMLHRSPSSTPRGYQSPRHGAGQGHGYGQRQGPRGYRGDSADPAALNPPPPMYNPPVSSEAAMYPQSQYQMPVYDAPAPMPQTQLMQAPGMAVKDVYLPGSPSSLSIIGDAQMDIMTTETQGTSVDGFSDNSYLMDPGMMTPGSPTDIKGLQSFMPYMGGGIGENDNQQNGEIGGPVDPNTGLPLFTTGKLIRSQLLGGHGAGSFLRQVQDPLTGYKKTVGKNLCGVQQTRRDLEVRRRQLNAARLEHPDADPILFNSSEFAYN